MSRLSILPESLAFIETWFVRLFLFLGFIAIGPWVALIIYDAALYLVRVATYDIPYIGGRARNRPRPRAPSLTERPNGNKRSVSLPVPPAIAVEPAEELADGMKKRVNSQSEGNQRANTTFED